VSLLVFAAVATAAAAAAYATRNMRRAGTIVGFAGLLLTLGAATAVQVGDRFEAAGGAIEATAYGRLFVLVGLLSATLVLVIARLTAWQRNAPAAVLGGAVSLALGLSSPDAAIGLLACGGAALVATLVALVAPLTPSRVRVLAREIRGAVVDLVLGLAAVSLVPVLGATAAAGRVVAGIALLLAATAVGHRLASVPFHARASRLAETAPALGLPLLLAWIPAAWAVVLLDWASSALDPTIVDVDAERLIVAAVAVATVLLATAAAIAQDEIEKMAAYAVVAAGALAVLAFAAFDPVARDGMRAWLPAFVAAAACLTGWTIAVRGAFGTGRIDDLAGWIRRAPVLATALVGAGVAILGWPGAVTWDGRAAVIAGVVGGPAPVLAAVIGLVPLLALARLVVEGAARPGPAAIAAPGERPRWGAAVLGGNRPAAHRQPTPAASPGAPGPTPGEAGEGDEAGAVPAGAAGAVPAKPAGDAAGDAAGDQRRTTGVAGERVAAVGLTDVATERDPAGKPARPAIERVPTAGRAGPSVGRDPAGASAADGPEGPPGQAPADAGGSGGGPWRGRAGLAVGPHRAAGRPPGAATVSPERDGHRREPSGGRRLEAAQLLLDANRVPVRSAVVLLLALTTLLAAAGAFDLRDAAAQPAPPAAAAPSARP
jgi:NADH:ubiquinone oxidoreductase subunit 2 (subunit N)